MVTEQWLLPLRKTGYINLNAVSDTLVLLIIFGFVMKITTNSQLLSSLTSLIDPNQRQQQQVLQDQQELRQKQEQKATEQASKTERQDRINANRIALKNLQDRLKADNLEKLKSEFSLENLENQDRDSGVNLNLRESLGTSNQPTNTRPGQIIDIRV